MSWQISGTYFESCNCEAICPCRRIDGIPGGRSTHGVCTGVLSWLIAEGRVDDVDLAGQPVALAMRYSDDEPGSPWTWKESELVAVRIAGIDVDHTRRRQRLLIRDRVSVSIRDRYIGSEVVTCVIPGHDRSGEELIADELRVEDGPLELSYRGTCGYGSTFTYAG